MATRLTINQTVTALREFCQSHKFLKGFGYGDLTDFETEVSQNNTGETGLNKPEKLPLMWVSPIQTQLSQGSLLYQFNVYTADAVKEDEKNKTEVESDCQQYLLDLVSYFAQTGDGSGVWAFERAGNISPFYDAYDNGLTGQQVNISLEIPFQYSVCDIPLADLYFWGEKVATSPLTSFDFFGGFSDTNYSTVFLGQGQGGQNGNVARTTTGFTLPLDAPGNVMPWVAVQLGLTIPGITAGRGINYTRCN
jgi:hypothetical protein